MSTMLRLRLAASIIDHLLRDERLDRLISEADVPILAHLSEHPGPSGSEIARWCGRTRANIHRSLARLERRKLVERLPSVVTGKTCGWTLTARGGETWRRASARLAYYDKLLTAAHPEFDRAVGIVLRAMSDMFAPRGGSFQRYARPPRRTRTLQWDL
jgi:DNA-binding MarR family transcriptional regulator